MRGTREASLALWKMPRGPRPKSRKNTHLSGGRPAKGRETRYKGKTRETPHPLAAARRDHRLIASGYTGRPEVAGACGRAGQQLTVADLAPEPRFLRHGRGSESSLASPGAGPPGPGAEPCARHEQRGGAEQLPRKVDAASCKKPCQRAKRPEINDGLKRSAKILGAMDAVDEPRRRERAYNGPEALRDAPPGRERPAETSMGQETRETPTKPPKLTNNETQAHRRRRRLRRRLSLQRDGQRH